MLKASPTQQDILKGLQSVGSATYLVPPDRIELLDPGREADNLDAGVVAEPETVEQIQAIVSWCADQGVGIVTHGGRTSLAGASRSKRGQLVLSTRRLNKVIEIDPDAATAIVEPGVTLANLQAVCAEHKLSPGIDLGARDSATIGGMVSTNAGGQQSFRFGVMRHRVLGLEAVLGDGRLFTDLKKISKSNEGFALKHLFIGGEGSLGVVTKIAVALVPADGHKASALVSCPDETAAVKAFRRLRDEKKLKLLSVEYMSAGYARVTAEERGDETTLAFEADLNAVFLLLDVPEEHDSILSETLINCAENEEVFDAVFAKSESDRAKFWDLREDVFRVEDRYPNGYSYDISLPISELANYLTGLRERLARISPELLLFPLGHIADGNLHLTVTSGKVIEEHEDDIADAINEGLAEIAGSFSAEHGIGTEKRRSLQMHVPDTQIELMNSVKHLFDPAGIMNPGKVL